MTHPRPIVSALALAPLLACVVTKPVGMDGDTDGATTGDPSTATAATATAATDTAETTDPGMSSTTPATDDGDDDPETGTLLDVEPGRVEYVGRYSSGFGFVYFTDCGETDPWFLEGEGIPSFEICDAEPYVRVSGILVEDEDGTLRLTESAILEGPCVAGGCADESWSGCTDFETACLPVDLGCDPINQDCPEPFKCSFLELADVGETSTIGCKEHGELVEGEACTRDGTADDCDTGLFCLTSPPGADGPGVCRSICEETSGCDIPENTCMVLAGAYGVCVPM